MPLLTLEFSLYGGDSDCQDEAIIHCSDYPYIENLPDDILKPILLDYIPLFGIVGASVCKKWALILLPESGKYRTSHHHVKDNYGLYKWFRSSMGSYYYRYGCMPWEKVKQSLVKEYATGLDISYRSFVLDLARVHRGMGFVERYAKTLPKIPWSCLTNFDHMGYFLRDLCVYGVLVGDPPLFAKPLLDYDYHTAGVLKELMEEVGDPCGKHLDNVRLAMKNIVHERGSTLTSQKCVEYMAAHLGNRGLAKLWYPELYCGSLINDLPDWIPGLKTIYDDRKVNWNRDYNMYPPTDSDDYYTSDDDFCFSDLPFTAGDDSAAEADDDSAAEADDDSAAEADDVSAEADAYNSADEYSVEDYQI